MPTDLKKIRERTIYLFDTSPLLPSKEAEHIGAVCHPFAHSLFHFQQDTGKWLDLSKPDSYLLFREHIVNQINSLSLSFIYDIIQEAYKLTWFQLCKDYMSREDFAYYLKHSWLDEEDPNQDRTVSLKEVVRYFRQAGKQYLMRADDLACYNSLPDTLTVYRGVSPHRARLGLSWTADKDMALWFKQRYEHSQQGELLTADISQKHVLAYINERNERELIVDVFKIQNLIKPL